MSDSLGLGDIDFLSGYLLSFDKYQLHRLHPQVAWNAPGANRNSQQPIRAVVERGRNVPPDLVGYRLAGFI